MSTNEWDTRYDTEDHPLWSGRANGVLVAEVASGAPGRALDVGCGEGADAIWLATCGWQVTGVDVSQIALDRAAAAAALAGVDVQWICADISAAPVDASRYELVSLHYPALKRSPDDHAVQSLLNAVAPGGTILVVGHAPLDPDYARAHGFDLADYVQVAEVTAALGDGWHVEVDETRAAGRPGAGRLAIHARRCASSPPFRRPRFAISGSGTGTERRFRPG